MVKIPANKFRPLLNGLGLTQSISGRRNSYDNAPGKSFFDTLKNKLLLSGKLQTKYKTRIGIFESMEIYYKKRDYIHSWVYSSFCVNG